MFKIYYGINKNKVDVTEICVSKLLKNNIINIPNGDYIRSSYFNDHLYGIHKLIFIIIDENTYEYDENYSVKINIVDNTVNAINKIDTDKNICERLKNYHSKLKIMHGSFSDEYPEQKMAVRYLTGKEKILEIGGNIGRNSLIIASILISLGNNNYVTLESDYNISKQLEENRNLNNFNFYIENAALSKRKLIQHNWDTIPSDILLDGYTWVNTITYNELINKYNIEFDTLVLDCEGAFYYILMDMPEILDNINLIIMENDYHDINHKIYIDNILTQHNFYIDYVEAGGWGCCYNNFFEVWKK
jgi:FkbM family methyltransferase